jgi:hypothetical protein
LFIAGPECLPPPVSLEIRRCTGRGVEGLHFVGGLPVFLPTAGWGMLKSALKTLTYWCAPKSVQLPWALHHNWKTAMATNLNRGEACTLAGALVKAALESGAIKLNGPIGMQGAEALAADDAKYLAKLVNDLTEAIKSPDFK